MSLVVEDVSKMNRDKGNGQLTASMNKTYGWKDKQEKSSYGTFNPKWGANNFKTGNIVEKQLTPYKGARETTPNNNMTKSTMLPERLPLKSNVAISYKGGQPHGMLSKPNPYTGFKPGVSKANGISKLNGKEEKVVERKQVGLQLKLGHPLTDMRLNAVPSDCLHVDNTKIYLKPFDMRTLRPKTMGFRVGITGNTGSGKTTLTTQLLDALRDIPVWSIFNRSEKSNRAYGKYMENELCIHSSANNLKIQEQLKGVRKRQDRCYEAWRIGDQKPPVFLHDPSAGVVLDDMNEDSKLYTHPVFGWLYKNSRNTCLLLIHLFQVR
jgi:hypothetical protein